MRPFLSVLIAVSLSSCARDRACDLMTQRLRAIDDLCMTLAIDVAKSDCEGQPPECEAVLIAKAEPACRAQARKELVDWALREFCD
jgi:hypothetical protein